MEEKMKRITGLALGLDLALDDGTADGVMSVSPFQKGANISRCFGVIWTMVSSRADDVLRHIERTARKEYLLIIGPEKGKIMNHLIRKINPKRILEVGTLVGYSTIIIGKDLESDAEIVIIEIDEVEARKAEENIRKAEIDPIVRILVGDALEIIPTLNGEFDFVFLDAAKSEYLAYLRGVEDKLRKGSVIVADNAGISSYSMRNYVRNSGKYNSRYMPANGDRIEVNTKL